MNTARRLWLVACVICAGAAAFGQAVPTAPDGFTVREIARFDGNLVRLADAGKGALYAMSADGNVWRVDLATGAKADVLAAPSYLPGSTTAIGLTSDDQGRLYVVANWPDASVEPHVARATIFRTTTTKNALPADPKPWFETIYPYGVDTFNHGVSKIAVGPDGFIYVSSGSRTDHGEARHEAHRSTEGEVPLTGCIWKLDPRADKPQAEIYASGIRNAFGFCWDGRGVLWATENGPNADAPEELNHLEHGKHYGFPYRFSDSDKPVYPDEPTLPPGLNYELPVLNDGPDAGKGVSTFDPHSSPSGIIWINDWGGPWTDGFLVGRFGNLIGPRDVGFDLLWVKVKQDAGRTHATVTTFLPAVGRVTDVIQVDNKAYICIYDMKTKNAGAEQVNGAGARILEVARK